MAPGWYRYTVFTALPPSLCDCVFVAAPLERFTTNSNTCKASKACSGPTYPNSQVSRLSPAANHSDLRCQKSGPLLPMAHSLFTGTASPDHGIDYTLTHSAGVNQHPVSELHSFTRSGAASELQASVCQRASTCSDRTTATIGTATANSLAAPRMTCWVLMSKETRASNEGLTRQPRATGYPVTPNYCSAPLPSDCLKGLTHLSSSHTLLALPQPWLS